MTGGQWLDFTVDAHLLRDRLPRLIVDPIKLRYEASEFVRLLADRIASEPSTDVPLFVRMVAKDDLGDLRYARMLRGAIEHTVERSPSVRVFVVLE